MGLRERKKLQQRHRLADVAAALFAERGYDETSINDVARAADVSGQTVYNYFPAKEDLVLDRAEEIRARYGRMILDRAADKSPASVVRELVQEDLERFGDADLRLARGEFPALCVQSAALRRFALEFRERQTRTVAEALLVTDPLVNEVASYAHAAALISVVQFVTDAIGAAVLADADRRSVAETVARDAGLALDGLDRHFADLVAHAMT
jgi:AcrR family transcriptional regulator